MLKSLWKWQHHSSRDSLCIGPVYWRFRATSSVNQELRPGTECSHTSLAVRTDKQGNDCKSAPSSMEDKQSNERLMDTVRAACGRMIFVVEVESHSKFISKVNLPHSFDIMFCDLAQCI